MVAVLPCTSIGRVIAREHGPLRELFEFPGTACVRASCFVLISSRGAVLVVRMLLCLFVQEVLTKCSQSVSISSDMVSGRSGSKGLLSARRSGQAVAGSSGAVSRISRSL